MRVKVYFKDGSEEIADFELHHNRRYWLRLPDAYWVVADRDIHFIEAADEETPVALGTRTVTLKYKAPKMLVNGHWLPGKVKPPKIEPDELMKRRRDLRWMYGEKV